MNKSQHLEPHIKESNYIRGFVFGFGDGINTFLGIVAGVGGANSSTDFIILAALVSMSTGAKAMAVQNYLAVKSQREVLEFEIKRQEFDIEVYPEQERILPYLLSKTSLPIQYSLSIAIAISPTSSFLIGAKKAKLARKNWIKGGIEMSALGTGMALLGYGIGAELVYVNLINY